MLKSGWCVGVPRYGIVYKITSENRDRHLSNQYTLSCLKDVQKWFTFLAIPHNNYIILMSWSVLACVSNINHLKKTVES